jgi:ketosteroid isomerase-like protein
LSGEAGARNSNVPSRTELAKEYLDKSMANDIDAVLALVTDDVVLNRGMLGPVTGKQAVADAMRNRPPGFAAMTPTFNEPVEEGETVTVRGTLPPGLPMSSLSWTFSFEDDKISRIEVGL